MVTAFKISRCLNVRWLFLNAHVKCFCCVLLPYKQKGREKHAMNQFIIWSQCLGVKPVCLLHRWVLSHVIPKLEAMNKKNVIC